MGEKLSAGLVTALIGGILGRAGYDGMVQVQSASALSTIYGLFVWLPYIFFGVVAIIICFYHLDKEYPMIMKELADREKPPN